MLNPAVFQELEVMWGPHTIDRFADMHNRQLERFNSRYWSPGTEPVDAFTCDWSSVNNWWCPPLYLIPRLIRHAEVTKARGTLVIPQWALHHSGQCCSQMGHMLSNVFSKWWSFPRARIYSYLASQGVIFSRVSQMYLAVVALCISFAWEVG